MTGFIPMNLTLSQALGWLSQARLQGAGDEAGVEGLAADHEGVQLGVHRGERVDVLVEQRHGDEQHALL